MKERSASLPRLLKELSVKQPQMISIDLKHGTKIALEAVPLASIIAKANLSKETVVISLKKEKIAKNIFIKDGELVFANSNAASDGFKAIMTREKKLSDSQLSAVDEYCVKNKAKFLDAVIALGYYPKDKVEILKELQVKSIIVDSFAMNDSIAEIIKNDSVFAKITAYRLETHRLLATGVSKYMTKEAVLSFLSDLALDNFFILMPKSDEDQELQKILPEEKGLIAIIQSSPKISETVAASFLKKDDVYKYLYCLLLFDYMKIETPEERESRLLDKSLKPEDKKLKASLVDQFEEIKKKNFYEILDVLEDAPQKELDEAYEGLKIKFDPLKFRKLFTGSEKDFPDKVLAKITEAYDVLSDEGKRGEYDSFVARGEAHKFGEKSAMLAREEGLKKANLALSNKNYSEAVREFESALAHAPEDTDIMCFLANALYSMSGGKNPDLLNKASSMLKKALSINPDNYKLHLELGLIFKDQGKSESMEFFKKALTLNPNCAEAEKEIKAKDPKAADLIKIKGLYKNLEKFNYYQLLNVPREASADEIKTAYYAATKTYHPDKYFTKEDEELKEMTKAIYKRLVEAYMVLKTSQKRQEYDNQLGQYKVEKEMRLKDASDVVQKKEKSELVFKSAQAKKFFELGLTSLSQKRLNAAKINFQLALSSEPDNIHIKRKLKEVQDMEKATGD